jgi:uncharacterized protein with FMN-binding domain
MRRFIAVFVATVAGLVVLLSFKDSPVKPPPAVALSSATPGQSSAPPAASSAPASSAAGSSISSDAASSADTSAPASSTPSAAPTAKASPTASKSSAKTTPKPTPKPSASSTTKTFTGSAVTAGERGRVFGTVQVRITLTNGKITAATAIDYPNDDPRSSEISSFSIPVLSREVLQAQGASIAVVSGATYTSDAYAQSVQAALDAAKA